LFLAASVIQLALGGFFGWLLRSGRPAASTETDQSKEQAQEMLQRLHALASSIGKNVGQHASRVEGINKELTEARERGDNEVEAVLLSAMAQIAESNERLQGQLRQAERKLEEHRPGQSPRLRYRARSSLRRIQSVSDAGLLADFGRRPLQKV
jgi:chromosome segregation ATPase